MHDHKAPQLIQIAPLEPQIAPVQRETHAQKPHDHQTRFLVGLDVGSTTVKAVAVEADSDRVLWQDYQRHETKQPRRKRHHSLQGLPALKRQSDSGHHRDV